MEGQEYVIKSTIDGMIKILINDFGMSEDEAKYFVYIKINQNNKDAVNVINKEELDLWYLADNDKYRGKTLNKHLSISFATKEKDLMHLAFTFLKQYFFTQKLTWF